MRQLKRASLSVAVAVALSLLSSCNGSPEKGAWAFAKQIDLPVAAITCTAIDQDGDGYVSCTFKMENGSVDYYDCASYISINRGCKPKTKVFQ